MILQPDEDRDGFRICRDGRPDVGPETPGFPVFRLPRNRIGRLRGLALHLAGAVAGPRLRRPDGVGGERGDGVDPEPGNRKPFFGYHVKMSEVKSMINFEISVRSSHIHSVKWRALFFRPSRARALNVEPGRAYASKNIPPACFEPELFT